MIVVSYRWKLIHNIWHKRNNFVKSNIKEIEIDCCTTIKIMRNKILNIHLGRKYILLFIQIYHLLKATKQFISRPVETKYRPSLYFVVYPDQTWLVETRSFQSWVSLFFISSPYLQECDILNISTIVESCKSNISFLAILK